MVGLLLVSNGLKNVTVAINLRQKLFRIHFAINDAPVIDNRFVAVDGRLMFYDYLVSQFKLDQTLKTSF